MAVICGKCGKKITTPRSHMKNISYMDCEVCKYGSFSKYKFSIIHFGNNEWSVKDNLGCYWCGNDEWVQEGSSFWELSDCKNKIFSWDEVKDFIEKTFSTYL